MCRSIFSKMYFNFSLQAKRFSILFGQDKNISALELTDTSEY